MRLVPVPAALLAVVTACAPTIVVPAQTYGGDKLPRPSIVVVEDFRANQDAVQVDRGIGARLRGMASGTTPAMEQTEADRKVTATISEVLVAEIRKLGLPAVLAGEAPAQTEAGRLIIGGEVLSVDEGNRTRRNLIGLGAGRSDVRARTDVYYAGEGAAPRLVESFAADAESGRKPGAAETMGAGAATGRLLESSAANVGGAAAFGGDVEADGERLAKAIAGQLGGFFAAQGWIPASAGR